MEKPFFYYTQNYDDLERYVLSCICPEEYPEEDADGQTVLDTIC